jgi:hypothetical protein
MRQWRRLKEDQAMRKATVIVNAVGLCLVALLVGIPTSSAQQGTTGKVTLESKSVAIGVGVSWGDGVLEYRGKKYPFSVEGLSVVDLGVSKVSAQGEVKNLQKVEDFPGTFVAAGAGAAVGGGAGVATMKNQNGVEMSLKATTQGVKLTLAGAGVTVKMKN